VLKYMADGGREAGFVERVEFWKRQ